MNPEALADHIRRDIIVASKRAGVGHIGSALSIADLVAAVLGATTSASGADRERIVLSKGHAALALYAGLEATGQLAPGTLESYCAEGSMLGAHPEHVLAGIDFSTGSLGQGLSIAAGCALAARTAGSPRRTFALMSDAELNEGSVWEAAMFAAHHQLANLVAVVDVNGQQALGYTRDVQDPGPLAQRWESFGWDVHEVDGHDPSGLIATIDRLVGGRDRPHVLLARTTFGKGVSFMEQRIEWHYLPMSDEQYADALRELDAATSAAA